MGNFYGVEMDDATEQSIRNANKSIVDDEEFEGVLTRVIKTTTDPQLKYDAARLFERFHRELENPGGKDEPLRKQLERKVVLERIRKIEAGE
jgi:hypothetical protein